MPALEWCLLTWHLENQTGQRLATIPGVGVITSTALVTAPSDQQTHLSAFPRRSGDRRAAAIA